MDDNREESTLLDFFVGEADNAKRLDAYVGSLDQIVSRAAAAKLIESGNVRVNGHVVAKKQNVLTGDAVSIHLPPPPMSNLIPEDIPLDIVFEDDVLIVLSKQANLVVHPAQGNWTGTLVNGLLAHAQSLGNKQGCDRPGVVHRLDKDTSGLMLAAKTDRAQARLQDDIRLREIDRRYLALVHGWIAPNTGMIDAPLGRHPKDRLLMCVNDGTGSKSAVTTFSVLERFEAGRYDDGFTLVECKLFSGRTHQIRVHMDYIHHPVMGDPVYGKGNDRANLGLNRQFLHSYSLKFEHPERDEELSFVDPLAADLRDILDQLAPLSCGRTEDGVRILTELDAMPQKEPVYDY